MELEIRADEPADVFAEAVDALHELLAEDRAAGEQLTLDVSLSAPDRAGLLADWLSELAYLAETEGFLPERLESLELGDTRVRAAVAGRRARPRHLVKAVTLHRLMFEPGEEGWRATVVLDV